MYAADMNAVSLIVNNEDLSRTGLSAAWDWATVHSEPVGFWAAPLPTRRQPVLVSITNASKIISQKVTKDAAAEARLFLHVAQQTLGGGRWTPLLTTDTPTAERAMYKLAATALPQLFWQPDICHVANGAFQRAAQDPDIKADLDSIAGANAMFLSSHFMISLLKARFCGAHRPCANRHAELPVTVFPELLSMRQLLLPEANPARHA